MNPRQRIDRYCNAHGIKPRHIGGRIGGMDHCPIFGAKILIVIDSTKHVTVAQSTSIKMAMKIAWTKMLERLRSRIESWENLPTKQYLDLVPLDALPPASSKGLLDLKSPVAIDLEGFVGEKKAYWLQATDINSTVILRLDRSWDQVKRLMNDPKIEKIFCDYDSDKRRLPPGRKIVDIQKMFQDRYSIKQASLTSMMERLWKRPYRIVKPKGTFYRAFEKSSVVRFQDLPPRHQHYMRADVWCTLKVYQKLR